MPYQGPPAFSEIIVAFLMSYTLRTSAQDFVFGCVKPISTFVYSIVLEKNLPLRFQAPCKFAQWYLQKAGCLCSERREASCRECFRFGIADIMSCFSHAVVHPIVHLYSKSHSLLSQKQFVFTLMIALYHKMCTIIWTYKTRPTIRNSNSGDAGFGA